MLDWAVLKSVLDSVDQVLDVQPAINFLFLKLFLNALDQIGYIFLAHPLINLLNIISKVNLELNRLLHLKARQVKSRWALAIVDLLVIDKRA